MMILDTEAFQLSDWVSSRCHPENTKILTVVFTATVTYENKSDVQGQRSSRQ